MGQTTAIRLAVATLVTAGVLVAGFATWLVLVERRFPTRRLKQLLGLSMAIDLVLFNCFVIRPPPRQRLRRSVRSHRPSGRPSGMAASSSTTPTSSKPPSSTNSARQISTPTRSVSERSGLHRTDARGNYVDATGAHFQEDLNPTTLAGGVWDDLNVSTLLSLPGYFLTPLDNHDHAEVRFPNNVNS